MGETYTLKITPLAYNDIDRVLAYIHDDLMNSPAAAKLLEEIEEKMQDIRLFPYAYPDCQYYFVPLGNYRHVLIGNYLLFFRVIEERHTVEVLRFLYSKMDFSKIQIPPDGQAT